MALTRFSFTVTYEIVVKVNKKGPKRDLFSLCNSKKIQYIFPLFLFLTLGMNDLEIFLKKKFLKYMITFS